MINNQGLTGFQFASVNSNQGPYQPAPVVFLPAIARDPVSTDVGFPLAQLWMNQSTFDLWYHAQDFTQNGIVSAEWLKISNGTGNVETITGDDGVVVTPVADNINLVGTVVANGTNAKPVFFASGGDPNEDLDVQVTTAAASSNINNAGLASFSETDFIVDDNGFVEINGSSSVSEFTVDAFTFPGTNPVVPNASGNITVTGGQVAAGTTANVIQTDSLAAHTYTIQVQRSKAVASSTVGVNGVCHFDSADFSVDANGFVEIAGSFNPFILQQVRTQSNTAAQYTPNMPTDNTIPTTSQGTQVFSLAITPLSATSTLVFEVLIQGNPTQNGQSNKGQIAVFGPSSANAIGSSIQGNVTQNYFTFSIASPGTSSNTYTVRLGAAGTNSPLYYYNSYVSTSNPGGGTQYSYFSITELAT